MDTLEGAATLDVMRSGLNLLKVGAKRRLFAHGWLFTLGEQRGSRCARLAARGNREPEEQLSWEAPNAQSV